MLDKKTFTLLKTLKDLCGEDTYKVIDAKSLLEKVPKKAGITEDSLNEMLKFLQENEYVDIKYSENNLYCLSVLTRGRLFFQKVNDENKSRSEMRKYMLWSAFVSGVMAFVGALVAILIFK